MEEIRNGLEACTFMSSAHFGRMPYAFNKQTEIGRIVGYVELVILFMKKKLKGFKV